MDANKVSINDRILNWKSVPKSSYKFILKAFVALEPKSSLKLHVYPCRLIEIKGDPISRPEHFLG